VTAKQESRQLILDEKRRAPEWRARERTPFWSFRHPSKARLAPYQFRGGTRLRPEMRSQENSDLTGMFKRVPPRLLLVPVFGNRMNGHAHGSKLFRTIFQTDGIVCIHSHTFLLCIRRAQSTMMDCLTLECRINPKHLQDQLSFDACLAQGINLKNKTNNNQALVQWSELRLLD